MRATVILIAAYFTGGSAGMIPAAAAAQAPAAAEPPPPPMPSPVPAPQEAPLETPTPMAQPEPLPSPGPPASPGETGVHAQGYEPRPLSGVGVALTAGGGVAGFFTSGARDAAKDGFTWDVRLTLG